MKDERSTVFNRRVLKERPDVPEYILMIYFLQITTIYMLVFFIV